MKFLVINLTIYLNHIRETIKHQTSTDKLTLERQGRGVK